MKMKMTTTMMMKSIALLLVAVGCCVCEPQTDGGGESSSSCALCSITETIEAMIMEKVKVLETRMEKNKKDLETSLEKIEKDVEEIRGRPQVAFSATLRDSGHGDIGPFGVDTPLKYKKVFSNTGNRYNPSTGMFTAQVKGMYFFRFTMFNNVALTPQSVVSLMKNHERLASVWDTSGSDGNDTGSNAVVIALEPGDTVYVEILANKLVYDDFMHYNTFSGFLLFNM